MLHLAPRCFLLSIVTCALWCFPVVAADQWDSQYQLTYIEQHKDSFSAPYSGPNSLNVKAENSYSFTATAFLGAHLWEGGELYANPEVSRGEPLSNLSGLGGFTNGEMARTSGPTFKLYRARLYLRQTWNLGGERETLEHGPNQLETEVYHNRLTLTVGNLSIMDIFDANDYAHDPRTKFQNWALTTYGAYDFPADARGYTWAAIVELHEANWIFRLGRGLLPEEPNGPTLDTRVLKHYGDQIEIERDYTLANRHGAAHVLTFRDRAVLARYDDALAQAALMRQTPDISLVRTQDQIKRGIGARLQQSFTDALGMFANAMWADGESETEAFATIDRSLSLGFNIQGAAWRRSGDEIGIAYAQNSISASNQQYLEHGGLGFFIGDGALRYRAERIVETYYNLKLTHLLWVSADFQHIASPAYNADRGSVNVLGIRLHTEL